MAPVRRKKQTARKVVGTGTATKTSTEEESLKLRRAERAEARRVEAEGDRDSPEGKATRRKGPGSRGAPARGRRGSRGGVQPTPQLGELELPKPNNSELEEIEEKMSDREFAEDEYDFNPYECMCIPNLEPKNDTFDADFYIDAYSL